MRCGRDRLRNRLEGDTLTSSTNSPNSELPPGWAWTTIGELAVAGKNAIVDGPFGTQMKVYEFTTQGVPVIEMLHLAGDRFNASFRRFITPAKFEEIKRSETKAGDFVVSKTGTLGTVAIVPSSVTKAVITSRLARIRLDSSAIEPRYAHQYLVHVRERGYWQKVGKGSTMKVLSLGSIKGTALPLPPEDEQRRIVVEIERRLSVAEAEERAIGAALKQAARLRQSILKRAFEGRLVPQDPTDEPAEKLLERIRAEKAKREAGRPRGRGRR